MKIKQTIWAIAFTLSLAAGGVAYSQAAYAATCGGVETSIITCDEDGKGVCAGTTARVDVSTECADGSTPIVAAEDTGFWGILLLVLNIMTAGVGILAVGGIVYGSALYASSSDKPEQAKQGMQYIKNVVIGLVAYGLMYIMLNFLIPGGIFT